MVTLEIDIGKIFSNIALIKRSVNAKIYAVVKANAYGHGIELCRHISDLVYGFAVSCQHEAAELINLGIKNPILILCPCLPTEPILTLAPNIIRTITDLSDLKRLKNCSVALKINTGMNRLGFTKTDFLATMAEIERRKDLKLCEIFTHFYSPEGAQSQFIDFFSTLNCVKYPEKMLLHCCSTNCLVLEKRFHLDAVRCGLSIYGYTSFGFSGLKPALSAYTEIEQINDVRAGESIGYGTYTAKKDQKIAVLKAGYADGFRRVDGQRVHINGEICDIVGNVCMDMCMADVSNTSCKRGDRAYILDEVIGAEQIAENQNSIIYEVLTGFSLSRIKRVYLGIV